MHTFLSLLPHTQTHTWRIDIKTFLSRSVQSQFSIWLFILAGCHSNAVPKFVCVALFSHKKPLRILTTNNLQTYHNTHNTQRTTHTLWHPVYTSNHMCLCDLPRCSRQSLDVPNQRNQTRTHTHTDRHPHTHTCIQYMHTCVLFTAHLCMCLLRLQQRSYSFFFPSAERCTDWTHPHLSVVIF